MNIALGSDHAGFRMKQYLVQALVEMGHQPLDMGTHTEESCDYPDLAQKVGSAVVSGQAALGILVCGTGIGMSMAANKIPGIRAALVHDPITASLARQHNDANVLCLGARLLASEYARELVMAWLNSQFESRHTRRLQKISQLECTARGEGRS